MGRNYKKKSRSYSRRRRFIYKTAKKSFRKTAMRRFLRRTPKKLEIKYEDTGTGTVSLTSGGVTVNNLSAASLTLGNEQNQRIGGQINIRKCYIRCYLSDNSGITGSTANDWPDSICRIIFWTPRVLYSTASTYMANNVTLNTIPDHNIVTTLYDKTYGLGCAYIDATNAPTTVLSAGAAYPNVRQFNVVLPFMRKAKFANTLYTSIGTTLGNAFDPDKDIMYYTVVAGRNSINFTFTCRQFYVNV